VAAHRLRDRVTGIKFFMNTGADVLTIPVSRRDRTHINESGAPIILNHQIIKNIMCGLRGRLKDTVIPEITSHEINSKL